MLLLDEERVCLLMLYIIWDFDLELKKLLLRESVLNKDWMDVNCILYLSKEFVLVCFCIVDCVVYLVFLDSYKIGEINKVGYYICIL